MAKPRKRKWSKLQKAWLYNYLCYVKREFRYPRLPAQELASALSLLQDKRFLLEGQMSIEECNAVTSYAAILRDFYVREGRYYRAATRRVKELLRRRGTFTGFRVYETIGVAYVNPEAIRQLTLDLGGESSE